MIITYLTVFVPLLRVCSIVNLMFEVIPDTNVILTSDVRADMNCKSYLSCHPCVNSYKTYDNHTYILMLSVQSSPALKYCTCDDLPQLSTPIPNSQFPMPTPTP